MRVLEKVARMARLYDCYGCLLTSKQCALLEMHYLEDLSLGEIAAEEGVSRQAVHDTIKRAEEALLAYEERLGFLGWQAELRAALLAVQEKLDAALAAHRQQVALLQEAARALAAVPDGLGGAPDAKTGRDDGGV